MRERPKISFLSRLSSFSCEIRERRAAEGEAELSLRSESRSRDRLVERATLDRKSADGAPAGGSLIPRSLKAAEGVVVVVEARARARVESPPDKWVRYE